ncbi:MAG: hypothetical protein GXO40_04140 [Epsilonproteobacteria bacterium]|nr:hypothetical protein [Campylobacterota bacterium]
MIKKYSFNIDTIVGVQNGKYYLLQNNTVKQITDIKSSHTIVATLPHNLVRFTTFEIEEHILNKLTTEEISGYIENEVYQNLKLDQTEEFIIKYLLDDNIAKVFIVSVAQLEREFSPIVDKTKYIDYLIYPVTAFEVLYELKFVMPDNDLFIHLNNEYVLMTLYSNGQFVTFKVIKYGLLQCYDNFIKKANLVDFEFEDFLELLEKKGVDIEKYSKDENFLFNILTECFSNLFLQVTNEVYGIQRTFHIKIDKIFLNTNTKISHFFHFSNTYLDIDIKPLTLNKYNPTNIKIDFLLLLSMLHVQVNHRRESLIFNWSIFKRPVNFLYRTSGKFVVFNVFLAAILLASMGFVKFEINNTQHQIQQLQNQLTQLQNQHQQLVLQSKQFDKDIKQQTKLLQKYLSIKKSKNQHISNTIALLSQILHKYRVYLKVLTYQSGSTSLTSSHPNNTQDITQTPVLRLQVYSYQLDNMLQFNHEILQKFNATIHKYIKTKKVYTETLVVQLQKK